jgi:hypothetical protein
MMHLKAKMKTFNGKTKKSNQRVLRAVVGFFILLASLPSLAADLEDHENLINTKTKELNLQRLAQLQSTANQRAMKLENVISYNSMPQYSSGGAASLKVLGQVSKAFVNAPQSNLTVNSSLQKLAKTNVNKAAQVGGMNVSVSMSASGARAEMTYGAGFTAAVSYDASSAPKIELNHPLGTNRSIAITHDAGPYGGSEDKIGIRWGF